MTSQWYYMKAEGSSEICDYMWWFSFTYKGISRDWNSIPHRGVLHIKNDEILTEPGFITRDLIVRRR